ncbi:MAG: DNA mismatch repair protein [Myxococcota bacterium]|nr:DNA mismatch repair protein [Myxococcota bacterium]
MKNIPDLLNHMPQPARDLAQARDELAFAFTSGDSAGALQKALDRGSVSDSDWQPDCFAEDLFVDELINSCLGFELDNVKAPPSAAFLKRVLCAPPADLDSVLFRQQVLRDLLESPNVREAFEIMYRKLIKLRTVLDSAALMGRVYSTRRQIDILVEIKETVDLMAGAFVASRSGISRIKDYACEFQASDGYKTLAEFLDYEDNLAQVQLHLRVGADGAVRAFRIVSIKENKKNRFFDSPLSRFIARMRLLFRGYGTSNDELIARWVDAVFNGVRDMLSHFLQLIGDMEFYLAALAFRDLCLSKGLTVCFPDFLDSDSESGREVASLFNPLLLNQEQPPVPCRIGTTCSDAIVIITGPNSGGKTRLLQALGLLQLLAQSGFFVPAKRARVRFASGLFVSLLETVKADQKEGRLGMELLRVRQLFEKSKPNSLILLDELCSGTNPSEGEEIFQLVISLLREVQPEAFISTHFLRLAKHLAGEDTGLGLEFFQVDLDSDHVPTYRFISGVAETSLAQQIARRLGVTRADLLALIRKNTATAGSPE